MMLLKYLPLFLDIPDVDSYETLVTEPVLTEPALTEPTLTELFTEVEITEPVRSLQQSAKAVSGSYNEVAKLNPLVIGAVVIMFLVALIAIFWIAKQKRA